MLRRGGGISRAQAAALSHPGYLSGGVYATAPTAAVATSTFSTPDRLYLLPFMVSRDMPATFLGTDVTVIGTSAVVKFGIWGANPVTLLPTGLPTLSNNNAPISSIGLLLAAVSGPPILAGRLWFQGFMITGGPTLTRYAAATYSMGWLRGVGGGGTTGDGGLRPTVDPAFATNIATIDLTGVAMTNLAVSAIPAGYLGT
jgi:hypothetical protein